MRYFVAFACLTAGLFVSSGCSSSAPPQTSQDVKNFQGGPMPPDVRKRFEEQQKENQQKINQNLPRK